MRGSLRNNIIAWSLVPTAIILIMVALMNLYAYQQVTETTVIERDRDLTQLSARLLAIELTKYTDPLAEQYLAVFDGMIVFDADGAVLAAEPSYDEAGQPNWFPSISLYRMLHPSGPVFSDVEDRQQGEKMVFVVMPIRNPNGELAGGIAGLISLDPTTDSALYRNVEKLRRGESNCVYLVDGNGRVIYHSTREHIGEDFSGQEAVERVTAGEVGALRTRDLDGHDIVASFAPVADTSWGLVSEEDWAALAKSSERYRHLLFALLALGVVLPTSIIAVGARRITQPINELIGAAKKIARGSFDQRITAATGDELEELARQFNRMTAQLEESYTGLEQKVTDRTRELATLNAIAAEVSRSLDLEEIMNSALDEVLEAMGMEKGQAFRLEEETQTLILMAHRGLSEAFVHFTARQALQAGVVGWAAGEGRPVVKRMIDYPPKQLRELAPEAGMQFVISVPLKVKEKTVGVIDLRSTAPRIVTPEELSLLTAIGHQVGVAVENAWLYEQARRLAVIEERNRLARDLHDSLTQALYGVTLCAEATARNLLSGDIDTATSHLREIQRTTHNALREMRLLLFELRPPILRRIGLAAALRTRLDSVEGRLGLEVEFVGNGSGRFSPEVEEGLYRIAQEALNNVLKHARANRVTICLYHNQETVSLEIIDDGIGFDPEAAFKCGGFGLRGMEERVTQLGGRLSIQSCPGEGTRIRVEVVPASPVDSCDRPTTPRTVETA